MSPPHPPPLARRTLPDTCVTVQTHERRAARKAPAVGVAGISALFFPWFVDERGPSQVVEIIVHPLAYGLVLVPFFLSVVDRRGGRAD